MKDKKPGAGGRRKTAAIIIAAAVFISAACAAFLLINRGGSDGSAAEASEAGGSGVLSGSDATVAIDPGQAYYDVIYDEEFDEYMDPTVFPEYPYIKKGSGLTAGEAETAAAYVAAAAAGYYASARGHTEFVSRNGYLFNVPRLAFVLPEDLPDIENPDNDHKDANALILFVSAKDAKGLGIAEDESPTDYTILAAAETDGGYALSDPTGSTAIVSEGELAGLLSAYESGGGQITRVKTKDGAFQKILKALAESQNASETYDVRSMAGDGKYVYAVVSPAGHYTAVKEFILAYENGEYKVILDKIERQRHKFAYISRQIPDFNLSMAPRYNLYGELKKMRTNFNPLIEELANAGIALPEDGALLFVSGNDDFVFLHYESGLRLLGKNNGINEWEFFPVVMYDEACARMRDLSKTGNPPYYLIKQR